MWCCILKIRVLIFVFLVVSGIGFSQEIKKTQDFGIWLSSSFNHRFKKDYTFSFSQDLRLFENSKEVEKYISEIGLDYQINKHFKLGGDIRYFLAKRKDKTIAQNWRYNFDFKYKKKVIKKTQFNYRLRFQSLYEDPFAVVSQGVKSNLRNLVGIKYKVNKRNRVELSAELFRSLVVYRKPYFNKIRLTLEDNIDTSIGKIGISFNYEHELNSEYPLNFFFFRINHNFKLKK